MAMFPTNLNVSDAKWIKRTSTSTSSLDFATKGFLTKTLVNRHIQETHVEISEATESAEYQVSLGNIWSNKIYVVVDGIFLRC